MNQSVTFSLFLGRLRLLKWLTRIKCTYFHQLIKTALHGSNTFLIKLDKVMWQQWELNSNPGLTKFFTGYIWNTRLYCFMHTVLVRNHLIIKPYFYEQIRESQERDPNRPTQHDCFLWSQQKICLVAFTYMFNLNLLHYVKVHPLSFSLTDLWEIPNQLSCAFSPNYLTSYSIAICCSSCSYLDNMFSYTWKKIYWHNEK